MTLKSRTESRDTEKAVKPASHHDRPGATIDLSCIVEAKGKLKKPASNGVKRRQCKYYPRPTGSVSIMGSGETMVYTVQIMAVISLHFATP